MERGAHPGPPLGNAYRSSAPRIPDNWRDALDAFEAGEAARPLFDPLLSTSIVHCKRQEMAVFGRHMSELEMRTYRGIV
jgi:glutamine synthetase